MLPLYLILAFIAGYVAGSFKGERLGRMRSLENARKWGQTLRRMGK